MPEFPADRRLRILGDPTLGIPPAVTVGGTNCPKCLAVASAAYCPGWTRCTLAVGAKEHLHWKCSCGYEWMTRCADAKEKP